jgi:hypothetical protein
MFLLLLSVYLLLLQSVPGTARLKPWFCDHSHPEIEVSNPTGDMDVSDTTIVCCQVQISWDELINCPVYSYRIWCVVCDVVSLRIMSWPTGGSCKQNRISAHDVQKQNNCNYTHNYLFHCLTPACILNFSAICAQHLII